MATIEGQNVMALAPPDNATAWFITVQDERGAVVSSRVMMTLYSHLTSNGQTGRETRPTSVFSKV